MKKILYGLLVLLLLIVTGCGGNNSTGSSSSPGSSQDQQGKQEEAGEKKPLQKVQLLTPVGGTAVYYSYVAKEAGFFAEEGLDVEIVPGQGSTYVVQQVGAGTVKIGITTIPALLPAIEKGVDLKAVYQINNKNLFDFIVPEESPVTKVADLKGKIVGISDLGGGEVPMVRAILADAGLSPEDYKLRAVGTEPPSILAAFDKKQIDAYSAGAHELIFLYAKGFKARSMVPKEYQNLPTTIVIVTGKTLLNERDMVAKVLRAIAKATQFSIANPDAAFAIMKKTAPEQYTDEKLGRDFLELFIGLTTPADASKGFGHLNKDGWELTQKLLSSGENPVLSKPLDLNGFLDDNILKDVNDFDSNTVIEKAKSWK